VVALLRGDGVGQHGHAHLGDQVGSLAGELRHVDRRRHHHDSSLTPLAHVRNHRPRAEERAAHVDAGDQIELAGGPFGQGRPVDGAGVVDQDVGAAEAVDGRCDHALDVVELAHVAPHGQRLAAQRANFFRGLVDGPRKPAMRLVGLGGDDDVATLPRQRQRDRAADPPR
jgi:hypothetical protein